MEIKQLQYFVTAADQGSLNRAAQQLYTSQPNVSKVIAGLEKELQTSLFERGNRGIRLTAEGEQVYGHAINMLKHANILTSMLKKYNGKRFCVSGYRSSLLTRFLTEIYRQQSNPDLKYEYREGTVEDITDDVAGHVSEIGIVYLAHAHDCCFKHIMEHKKLEFHPLASIGISIYVGKNHPLYERKSIGFSELKGLKFVEETEDFYALEHNLEQVSVGMVHMGHLNNVFYTNSDYMINNLLLHTDVCCMGVDLVDREYHKYDIRALPVEGSEAYLNFGYVTQREARLSAEAVQFLDMLKKIVTAYNKML
ncbi:MAG: LysR family transcriptional regulator [Lachnospiraceae bacterium]